MGPWMAMIQAKEHNTTLHIIFAMCVVLSRKIELVFYHCTGPTHGAYSFLISHLNSSDMATAETQDESPLQ